MIILSIIIAFLIFIIWALTFSLGVIVFFLGCYSFVRFLKKKTGIFISLVEIHIGLLIVILHYIITHICINSLGITRDNFSSLADLLYLFGVLWSLCYCPTLFHDLDQLHENKEAESKNEAKKDRRQKKDRE